MPDINFPSFPAGSAWKMPLFWLETDPSQAGSGEQPLYELYVGQAFIGGNASVAIKTGIVGNGILSLDPANPVIANGQLGLYKVKFTSPTAFAVTDPSNAAVGTGVVGTPFATQLKFTVAAGGTAFAVNDEFDVTVAFLPKGIAAYNLPIAVASLQQAQNQFGIGSMLERMFARAFAINPTGVKYCVPLADAAGAISAGSMVVTTAPASNGILSLYIAGQLTPIEIDDDFTMAECASGIVAALNAVPTLPVIAAVDGTNSAKVNLSCKWKGVTGNDIDIRFNYRGTLGGEAMPPGLAVSITPMAGGTGTPSMSSAIATLGDGAYEFVGMPYTDTVSMGAWDTEYGFSASGRWGWMRQLYGSIFSARRDTFSNLFAWGPGNNSAVISPMAVEPTSPTPVWEWTAAYTAAAAVGLLEDPGRPLQTLEMTGVLPAPKSDRWTLTEANGLAGIGLAVQQVGPSGYPQIMVENTEWQVNAYGAPDNAFTLVTTLHTLAWLYRRFRAAITSKYPRQKLANDGTKFASGQAIITPSIAKAEVISEYKQAEYLGMVENSDDFIANLIVRRNSINPNRLDVVYPPDIINQLRLFAVVAQFRLQYPNTLTDVATA